MLKLIIRRWKRFTPGQRATLWLAAFLSPLLSLLLYKIQEALALAPVTETPISAAGLILVCYSVSVGTVTTVALLAHFSQNEA